MPIDKRDILRQLQEELLPLQGFRPPTAGARIDMGLGPMAGAFPRGVFPTGAIHEFLIGAEDLGAGKRGDGSREEVAAAGGFAAAAASGLVAPGELAAAAGGFVAALLAPLMRDGGVCLWVGTRRTLFPPALKRFGVDPDKIVFVDLRREKDAIWVMEEALKCEGLAAVVGEIRELDFTASRKLQLAVEKSRVTGFLLRHQPRIVGTVAAVARWKIGALASVVEEGMPGVGLPRWKVELLKVRNGVPGEWIVEWVDGRIRCEGLAADGVRAASEVGREELANGAGVGDSGAFALDAVASGGGTVVAKQQRRKTG